MFIENLTVIKEIEARLQENCTLLSREHVVQRVSKLGELLGNKEDYFASLLL